MSSQTQAHEPRRLGFKGKIDAVAERLGNLTDRLEGSPGGSRPSSEGVTSSISELAHRVDRLASLIESMPGLPDPPPQPPQPPPQPPPLRPLPAPAEPGPSHTNSVGMKMVQVPAGEFYMGTSEAEVAVLKKEAQAIIDQAQAHDPNARLPWLDLWIRHLDNEGPQHHVKITRPFCMGAHEVTVGQWQHFVRETGYLSEVERFEETGVKSYGLDLTTGHVEPKSYYTWRFWLRESEEFPSGFKQSRRHPVVCVSWNDARAFCEWLSKKEGKTYRLPTEAEWEYACRAGSTGRYSFGDDEEGLRCYGNVADASLKERWKLLLPTGQRMDAPPYAKSWHDGVPFTAKVGAFEANAWGLYDMHGNGGEWCLDWYAPYGDFVSPDAVLEDPLYDPADPPPVDYSDVIPGAKPRPLRMIRSGVWLDPAFGFRSADRETHRRHPVDSAADISFRVVCSEVEPNRLPGPKASVVLQGEGRQLDDQGNFFAKVTSEQSDGATFVFSAMLPGDHPGVPLHLHVDEVEILEVTEGEFVVEWGDPADPHNREKLQRGVFGKGTVASFPKMTPHGFRNASTNKADRASALIIVVPGGLEALYEEARGLSPEEFVGLGIRKYGMVTLGPPPALKAPKAAAKKPKPAATKAVKAAAAKPPAKKAATGSSGGDEKAPAKPRRARPATKKT